MLRPEENTTGIGRLTRTDLGLPGTPARPRNGRELRLLRLWGEVLDVDGLGVEDDFFAAGGDSLAAAALCAGIEREFAVVLPVSVLLSARTPRALTREVNAARARVPAGCLVRVRPGQRPAAVFVHGMPGDVVLAQEIAPFLGEHRQVDGLRAWGLADGEAPLASVPEMAAHYLDEMLAADPQGPYLLAGYCGGTIVAYEMALQLTARGGRVLGVALADPPTRLDYVPWLHGRPPRAPTAPPAAISGADGQKGELRRQQVRAVFEAALAAYVPKPYGGPILVVHCRQRGAALRDARRGWPRYGGSSVSFAEVDTSDHNSIFAADLEQTARALEAFFDRVAPVAETVPEIAAAQ